METQIKLHKQQYAFFTCPARVAAYIGGIRSGKTYSGVLWSIQQAQAGALVLVVAPTYSMLRDVDWAEAERFLGDLPRYNGSEMSITLPDAGKILFRSADNPNRIRGITAGAALIDEAGYCPPETYDVVLGRLSSQPGHLRIVTTPRGRNWLYERQNEMTIFRSSTYENKALTKEYLDTLTASYSGNFARQELYGEFVAFEGLVYQQFSRDVNVKTAEEIGFTPDYYIIGNDAGYTNPSAILLAGVDADGRVHIYSEWYMRQQLQDVVVAENARLWRATGAREIVVDSSAAGLIAAMRDAGLPATAHKSIADANGLNAVRAGIAKIQGMLPRAADNKPRLTIDPQAIFTIGEMETYCYRDGSDDPEKQNDHAMDALRYIIDSVSRPTLKIGW